MFVLPGRVIFSVVLDIFDWFIASNSVNEGLFVVEWKPHPSKAWVRPKAWTSFAESREAAPKEKETFTQ